MKYCFLLLLIISLFSCQKEEIATFSGKNQIYFEKYFLDEVFPGTNNAETTEESFFFYPSGTKEIKVGLAVCLSGNLLKEDTEFKLVVDEKLTTAKDNEYTIPDNFIFHANNINEGAKDVLDTIELSLLRTDRLSNIDEPACLVVELVPNDNFDLGQYERRKAKILFTAKAVKPDWWDKEVKERLLGTYSQKKYKLFLTHADTKSEMSKKLIEETPSRAIELALKFREWLSNQNPKILEENGQIMTLDYNSIH